MDTTLKVILHAPDAEGYQRAYNNARNILKVDAATNIVIILNAKAVAAAIEAPENELDSITRLCPVTLQQTELKPRSSLTVLPHSSAYEIAVLQTQGWAYIRS